MSPYNTKPVRLLEQLSFSAQAIPTTGMFCAGFELASWRCDALADHLIEWIADYALHEDELKVNHGNMYVRLREAAARIYTSKKYGRRGEVGEIALHAICRDFFGTVPIAPRVFYLTSSNDVVKSFDMVHVRYVNQVPELWLGEAKFYANGVEGARAAVTSLTEHLDQGFLRNEKLILGPQISKNIPEYAQIRELLSSQTSLDRLFQNAVFPVFIACESNALLNHKEICAEYICALGPELSAMAQVITSSGLTEKVRILLLHLPLGSKKALADSFDLRLKGLAP